MALFSARENYSAPLVTCNDWITDNGWAGELRPLSRAGADALAAVDKRSVLV
jgi:hypothetical protein